MPSYFMLLDGKRLGPYEPEELVQAGMSRSTLVWRDGMEAWMRADAVPELVGAPVGIPPDVPIATTSSTAAAPATEGDVVSAIGSAVARGVRPFPIGFHICHLLVVGLCILVSRNVIDRSGAVTWILLVPAPILGLIGLFIGKRSVAFWWGYWLGPIGWIIVYILRVTKSTRW